VGDAKNVYIVALGTIIGHMVCTAIAVIAGRYVSTKISAKHGMNNILPPVRYNLTPPAVTLGGAALFLCFGVVYLYEAGQAAGQAADIDPQDHIPRG
jgi:Ca2+/H+ antiporter, TMEM165/GDT1 family